MFPMYSYKLYKTVNVYIRYIRIHVPRRKHLLKSTLLDLFDIKRILKQKMIEFPNFECFENINDLIVATIVSIIKIQHTFNYINNSQMVSYINTATKL